MTPDTVCDCERASTRTRTHERTGYRREYLSSAKLDAIDAAKAAIEARIQAGGELDAVLLVWYAIVAALETE